MNKPQLRLPLGDDDLPLSEPKVWRPIHYLGSKLRIIGPLRAAIDSADSSRGTACDLFAGSGIVSAALGSSREVVSVDIQEYSRVLCSAVLHPTNWSAAQARKFTAQALNARHEEILSAAAPLIEHEGQSFNDARKGNAHPLCELLEHASLMAFQIQPEALHFGPLRRAHKMTLQRLEARNALGLETLTFRHFGGLYFSYMQALQLDALLTAANEHEGQVRDFLIAALISTASDIVNTVGQHFAQPIRPRSSDGRPKHHLINKILRDRELDVPTLFSDWLDRYRLLPDTGHNHQAIRGDFDTILKSLDRRMSVVYADPPYTRDHYSRFYHVLETMCLRDEPQISTTRIHTDGEQLSRGMYRKGRHQSPFCIVSQAPDAFRRLFAAVRDVHAPLVLSYSPYAADSNARPRVMTVEQISHLASDFFPRVEVSSAGRISHSKLNTARLNTDSTYAAEIIFVCS